MKAVGCTSPIFRNKSNICIDSSKAKKSFEVENEIYKQALNFNVSNCPFPCQVMITRMEKTYEHYYNFPLLEFHFKKLIKVTSTFKSYQGLELMAEVGGYVGLFLGVSVFHISHVFEKLLSKLNQ